MEKQKEKNYISSLVLGDGTLIEMVYDKQANKTKFIGYNNGNIEYYDEVEFNGKTYHPFSTHNNLINSDVVLFPSDVCDYQEEKELIIEVKQFIHKYLGISSFFEELATYYVLFTWLYDCFNELPYLRALADYGCGKSRFLKTIGSLCYKPMFTAGATSVSPIFRIIDMFRGTLVLDEADMKFSDIKSEMVKILNSGFSKGTPVMRSEERRGYGYDIRAFNVYGPKLLATREIFYDKALESRFLIEEMDSDNLRDDIPINLPDSFNKEATQLRNKLLMWRFKNYGVKIIDYNLVDKLLEPRLNQIILPIMTIIKDEELRDRLRGFIREHNKQLMQDRGFSLEADILGVIIFLRDGGYNEITIGQIKDKYNNSLNDGEKKMVPQKVGKIVREKLKLKYEKKRDGYTIDMIENKEKMEKLMKKYDVYIEDGEQVNSVNSIYDGEITMEDIPM